MTDTQDGLCTPDGYTQAILEDLLEFFKSSAYCDCNDMCGDGKHVVIDGVYDLTKIAKKLSDYCG